MNKKLISIAHSPDSDDAFMFYALKFEKITHPEFSFQIERADIEFLNQKAKEELYDISAISIHAYAHLTEKYALLSSGTSMAEKHYGPLLVAKKPYQTSDIKHLNIAIPGEWTTAFLVLKLIEPHLNYTVIPFQEIIPSILNNKVDAGLLIHEGQLQYQSVGLHKILGLIDFWNDLTHKHLHKQLALPLGGNAIKKSLGHDTMQKLSSLQQKSIAYAMDHHHEAREYARQFKRDLTATEADEYLSWYANHHTLALSEDDKLAIGFLLDFAYQSGALPHKTHLEII